MSIKVELSKNKMSPAGIIAVIVIVIICCVGISMCRISAEKREKEDFPFLVKEEEYPTATLKKVNSTQWIQLHNGDKYLVRQVLYVSNNELHFTDDKDVIQHIKLDDMYSASPQAAADIANKTNNTK